jgi:bacterial surface protein 26-residue repeat/bacterial surface protein 26-residue repeat
MALNKVLGSFKPDNLFAANQELPAVADSIEIAAGQFLKRGSLVNRDGVLVSASDTDVYAVLARDCDTTEGASEAPVYLTGEFNTDAVKVNDNVDNMFAVCVSARKAGIFLKPHAKMPPVDPMTLRFKFGKEGYVPPTLAKGTWSNVAGDIWDWTCEDPNWSNAFGSGGTTNPGVFGDLENPVQLIAAGDTSAVTDFSRLFQNCYALAKVCPFDTSGASTAFLMFSHCENVEDFFDLDLTNATGDQGTMAIYQWCKKMKRSPKILLPSVSCSLKNLFFGCTALEEVQLFDTSKVTNMNSMFSLCCNLHKVPSFDTSNVTNMRQMFGGTSSSLEVEMNMEEIPNFDYGKVTTMYSFFQNNVAIREIRTIDIPAVTNVTWMFKDCVNVERGALDLHRILVEKPELSQSSCHQDCFVNCGKNTESGLADLRQIPADWGGLAE